MPAMVRDEKKLADHSKKKNKKTKKTEEMYMYVCT